MYLKKIIISLFIMFNFCKTRAQQKYEGKELCLLINEMNEKDQEKRKLMIDPFFSILDSIKKAEGISKEEYKKFPREKQLAYGKIAREITNKQVKKYTKEEEDSIMDSQIELDNENTELLIDIIEKRGYPNKNNCECKTFPGLIFVHSQKKYWGKIRTLIEIEYKEKRMEIGTYKYILWHINERKGTPFRLSINKK